MAVPLSWWSCWCDCWITVSFGGGVYVCVWAIGIGLGALRCHTPSFKMSKLGPILPIFSKNSICRKRSITHYCTSHWEQLKYEYWCLKTSLSLFSCNRALVLVGLWCTALHQAAVMFECVLCNICSIKCPSVSVSASSYNHCSSLLMQFVISICCGDFPHRLSCHVK